MGIKVITPPSESITRAEAKLHLRLDDISGSHPHDSMIDGLITAAREYAEHYTQVSIGSQTLELALDEFPESDGAIELRRGPVTAITSVTYVDEDGATQTLASANYTLDDYSTPNWLLAAYDTEWPTTRDTANAVKVRYVAGATTTPKAVKDAMLLHIQLSYPANQFSDKDRDALAGARDALLNTVKVWGY